MKPDKYILIFLLVFALLILICFVWLFILPVRLSLPAAPSDLFERYVLNPIPASVAELKASQTKEILGYGYAFRFKISRQDAELIINSRPFRRVSYIHYENDILRCEWDSTSAVSGLTTQLYSPDVHKPAWFRLEEWDAPKAYVIYESVESQQDLLVLVHNEDIGEAYFIVWQSRG